jgi:hypothetical protein
MNSQPQREIDAATEARLPTFFVIGAMRSGTTSLHSYLRSHPDIYLHLKEPHFFDGKFERGLDWYRNLFAEAADAKAVGESTPTYMYSDLALTRMREIVPEARLVAMLRNPVERAYSHYWMNRARDKENRSFETAVSTEIEGGAETGTHYVDFGLYKQHLERVSSIFDRSALHVELLEDMQREPAAVYERICGFLGVDSSFLPTNLGQPVNSFVTFRSVAGRRVAKRLPKPLKKVVGRLNAQKRTYPPMIDDDRALLDDYFSGPNRELGAWLGRNLDGVWPQGRPPRP